MERRRSHGFPPRSGVASAAGAHSSSRGIFAVTRNKGYSGNTHTLQSDCPRVDSKNKTSICQWARIHWEQQGTLVCETGGETMSLRHQARWIIDLSPSWAKNRSLANLCTPCTEWGNGKSDQLSTWGRESLNPGSGVANYNYISVCDGEWGGGRICISNVSGMIHG